MAKKKKKDEKHSLFSPQEWNNSDAAASLTGTY